MKTIFTLLFSLAFSISFAQRGQSYLSVTSLMSSPIRIMVDNRQYSNDRMYDNDLLIRDLRPGYHTVKVYRINGRYNNGRWGSQVLVYSGNLFMRPQYHTDIIINRFGRAFVDEQMINFNDDGYNGGWIDNSPQAMDDRSFAQFKETVRNASFDNTKLTIAKQTISQNNVTAVQVKEIMSLFSFEDSKLALAKYAYEFTIDKNNYFTVSDGLSFSSSKEDLMRFISNGGR